MDRVFMTREEAIRVVLEAHEAASGTNPATLIRSAGAKSAKVQALERLLLDVRAGRIDEFSLEAGDSTLIAITD